MRALGISTAAVLFAIANPALAESRWLESGRLDVAEIRALCERVSDIRMLARMQIGSVGDERWRRLSRQELIIEVAGMGVPPLDPSRCYVIASAGPAAERVQRAFEVRDFADSPERTSVFVVGRKYDQPGAAQPIADFPARRLLQIPAMPGGAGAPQEAALERQSGGGRRGESQE